MKTAFFALSLVMLTGCAVPTTGVVPRADGLYTVTRQGEGFWVQPSQLTALASQDAAAACSKMGKQFKLVHYKEIPAGAFGRWPESEVLYRCE